MKELTFFVPDAQVEDVLRTLRTQFPEVEQVDYEQRPLSDEFEAS